MTLQGILSSLKVCTPIVLTDNKHCAINTQTTDVFYIEPEYKEISCRNNSKIIVFSAPGATGKSTLAKHIAFLYNAIYWDLAKMIRLGEDTFGGVISRAVGYESVSSFFTLLHSNRALVVIDAFDEADIASGRASIELLLGDIANEAQLSSGVSFILLSRSDTAKVIKDFLEKREVPISEYEIGLFSEFNAKSYIERKISSKDVSITQTIKDCISEQFKEVSRLLNGDMEAYRSFIGYAPVLDLFAKLFDESKNAFVLRQQLEAGLSSSLIVKRIMEELLQRDQDKVCAQLKGRWAKTYPDFSNWDAVFTAEEQLTRVASFLIFGDPSDSYYSLDYLPIEMRWDYAEAINDFLPQHVFIRCDSSGERVFVGPAFRDFCLALVITLGFDELAREYYLDRHDIPSQLLFDYYQLFPQARLKSIMIPYMIESFRASYTSKTFGAIDIEGTDIDNITMSCSLLSIEGNEERNYVEFKIVIVEGNIVLDQIVNFYVDVPCDIHIGRKDGKVIIRNSQLKAKRIVFDATDVFIEARNGESVVLQSTESSPPASIPPCFDIRVTSNSDLKVSKTCSYGYYKLSQYIFDFINEESREDYSSFVQFMIKLTRCFRSHGRENPGRYRDYVDNLIVGTSRFRRSIFSFLQFTEIIFIDSRNPNLYMINTVKSSKYKINWGALKTDNPDALRTLYDAYKNWLNQTQTT